MWAPDGSGELARYVEKSLGGEFDVVAPEMPDAESDPRYDLWRDAVAEQLARVDGQVVLVGHSFGGSVLLKYLAEGPPPAPVAGLFLVAVPWWGPEGWDYEDFAPPADFASRLPRTPVFLYHSREDPHVPFDHLSLYEKQLPNATSRPIEGTQHSFTDGLPALVEDIRRLVHNDG